MSKLKTCPKAIISGPIYVELVWYFTGVVSASTNSTSIDCVVEGGRGVAVIGRAIYHLCNVLRREHMRGTLVLRQDSSAGYRYRYIFRDSKRRILTELNRGLHKSS